MAIPMFALFSLRRRRRSFGQHQTEGAQHAEQSRRFATKGRRRLIGKRYSLATRRLLPFRSFHSQSSALPAAKPTMPKMIAEAKSPKRSQPGKSTAKES